MQDRFKFRAWSFDNKKYYPQNEQGMFILGGELPNGTPVGVSCSVEDLVNSENYGKKFIVEQCTGLKDKNGKLIYEGDIVETHDYTTEHSQIVWDKSCYVLKSKDAAIYEHLSNYEKQCAIIGNIHENPELLEEQ